jgi:hypothetical protein
MNDNSHKELEQFIHQNLSRLPERRAPRSLEHRVMAAIAARQALPWYRQSFTHWPATARAAFLGTCVLAIAAIIAFGSSTPAPIAQAVSETQGRISLLASLAATLRNSGNLVVGHIPSLWIYGILAALATAYATLFGIGATAYRTLFANR